jgi:GNAT superfamily N-acetyltransferase
MMEIISAVGAIGAILAVIVALVTYISTAKKQQEIESKSIYQQLELASIEFFKWEASYKNELARIFNEYKKEDITISDEDEILMETWCWQQLNLFELCLYNINKKHGQIFPSEVFGSWLPWIHEFAQEPCVIRIWPEIKYNYLPECRETIENAIEHPLDEFIIDLCQKYNLESKDWIKESVLESALKIETQYIGPGEDKKILHVDIKKGKLKNIKKYLDIFNECKHDSYISHGEVLCGRATHAMKWTENIINHMKREFIDCILNRKYDLFEIQLSGEIMGFAILELYKKTRAAILSDIMIKRNNQGKGVGREALHKIEEYLRNKGIGIMLLESGVRNEDAHHFFEKNGHTKISVQYSKCLN